MQYEVTLLSKLTFPTCFICIKTKKLMSYCPGLETALQIELYQTPRSNFILNEETAPNTLNFHWYCLCKSGYYLSHLYYTRLRPNGNRSLWKEQMWQMKDITTLKSRASLWYYSTIIIMAQTSLFYSWRRVV